MTVDVISYSYILFCLAVRDKNKHNTVNIVIKKQRKVCLQRTTHCQKTTFMSIIINVLERQASNNNVKIAPITMLKSLKAHNYSESLMQTQMQK